MQLRDDFLNAIENEYLRLTKGKVPDEFVTAVSKNVMEYYYDQYQRFRKQYPKSIKRYSSFQIKDLDHPYTREMVIKTLKEMVGDDYERYATLFLNMTPEELKKFEKNREEFYKMF